MSVMLPLRFLHGVLSTCLSLVAPEIWSFWLQIHVRSVKCCNQPSSSPLFYLSCLINVPGTICEILQNVGHLSTNMNPVALFFFSFFFGDLYNRIKHLPNIWKYRKTVIQLCTSSVTFCFCSCLASTCVCFVFFTRLKMSSGSWGCSFIKSPVCNSDHHLLNLTVKVSLIWGAFSYHCSIFNLVLIMVFLEMCITCSSLNLGYHSVLILM